MILRRPSTEIGEAAVSLGAAPISGHGTPIRIGKAPIGIGMTTAKRDGSMVTGYKREGD